MVSAPFSIEQSAVKAEAFLRQSESEFALARTKSSGLGEPLEDFVGAQMCHLLLQYRLDQQDALMQLMRLERSVLQVLGLEPMAAASVNLDRLSYALGFDELRHYVDELSQIIRLLSKLLQHKIGEKHHFANHEKLVLRQRQSEEVMACLEKARKHQKAFKAQLFSLTTELEHLVKLEATGPVFDHISALQGPISRFYQCIQYTLEQSQDMFNELSKGQSLIQHLQRLKKEVETLLEPKLLSQRENTLFCPHTRQPPADSLEVRAEKRRLSQFFYHQ